MGSPHPSSSQPQPARSLTCSLIARCMPFCSNVADYVKWAASLRGWQSPTDATLLLKAITAGGRIAVATMIHSEQGVALLSAKSEAGHLGITPVHAAAAWGSVEVLQLLLSRGGLQLAEVKDGRGRTAVDVAVGDARPFLKQVGGYQR